MLPLKQTISRDPIKFTEVHDKDKPPLVDLWTGKVGALLAAAPLFNIIYVKLLISSRHYTDQ